MTERDSVSIAHGEIPLYNTESWYYEDFEIGVRVRSIRRTIS